MIFRDQVGVFIMDGGNGTELSARGARLHPAYWSGLAHVTHPDLMKEIHCDYIGAGADIITANTMMANRHILESAGITNVSKINHEAVKIAKEARSAAGTSKVKIAGSMTVVPPLDGADHIRHGEEVIQNYREQANLLKDAGVDLLLLEMLIDCKGADEILSACCEVDLPVWAGLSAIKSGPEQVLKTFRQPGKLARDRHETFEELVIAVSKHSVSAMGVMHSQLEAIEPALEILSKHTTLPLFAYANIGIADEHEWVFDDNKPVEYANQAVLWCENYNIFAVGGCCGTTPDYIKQLSGAIRKNDL